MRSACRTAVAHVAYSTHASRQPWAIPTQPAAREMRPLSRADIATLKPSPSAPSRFESGTRTPSRNSFGRVLSPQPELALDLRRREPGRARRHQKARQPASALVAAAGEDERNAGPAPERDEDLRTGEHPVTAVALRACDETCRVGSGSGLRECVAPERALRRQVAAATRASVRRFPTSRSSSRRDRGSPRRCPAPRSRLARAPPSVGSTRQCRGPCRRTRSQSSRRGNRPRRASRRARGRALRRGPSRARAGRSRGRRTPAQSARISSCSSVREKSIRKRRADATAPALRAIDQRPLIRGPNSVNVAVAVAQELQL